MITALLGIQTVAIVTATSYIMKNSRKGFAKVRLHSKSNGFKHYKTF